MKKKKRLMAVLLLLMSSYVSFADEKSKILVYADGIETSYLLTENPKIIYTNEEGEKKAHIYIDNQQQAVLTVKLTGDAVMRVIFADETDVQTIRANHPLLKNGKVIKYGKVRVIKDGKEYDINGTLITQ